MDLVNFKQKPIKHVSIKQKVSLVLKEHSPSFENFVANTTMLP